MGKTGGKRMLERFFPDVVLDSIEDITPEFLAERGIKAVLLDIDNTLVPYATRQPDERARNWFDTMEEAGIKIWIISNAKEKRVREFMKDLNFDAVYKARKPGKACFRKVLDELGMEPRQVAMVGDQIFTDVWGGRRSGLYTILVQPIDNKENPFIKLKRILEIPVLFFYGMKNGSNSNRKNT